MNEHWEFALLHICLNFGLSVDSKRRGYKCLHVARYSAKISFSVHTASAY